MQTLIDNFLEERRENIECQLCRSDTACVSENIVNNPNVLTISLLRFGYDTKNKRTIKNTKEIEIPEYIEIDKKYYKLQSLISHKGGSASSGHYTALVKKNTGWFLYDDNNVKKSSLLKKNSDVYLLFYVKI